MEQWSVYTAAAGRRRVPMVTKGYQWILTDIYLINLLK